MTFGRCKQIWGAVVPGRESARYSVRSPVSGLYPLVIAPNCLDSDLLEHPLYCTLPLKKTIVCAKVLSSRLGVAPSRGLNYVSVSRSKTSRFLHDYALSAILRMSHSMKMESQAAPLPPVDSHGTMSPHDSNNQQSPTNTARDSQGAGNPSFRR